MYGKRLGIKTDRGIEILLRPAKRSDLERQEVADAMSSREVIRYMGRSHTGNTIEQEAKAFERWAEDRDSINWIIALAKTDEAIGATGIHERWSRPTTGMVLWKNRGEGIGRVVHTIRVLQYVEFGFLKVHSCARSINLPSVKGLEGAGFTIWGTEPWSEIDMGDELDTSHMIWFNPVRVTLDQIPEQFRAGWHRAKERLEIAKKTVQFL